MSIERFGRRVNRCGMLMSLSITRGAFGATRWNGRIYMTGENLASNALNTLRAIKSSFTFVDRNCEAILAVKT